MKSVSKEDHPDFVGGIVWSRLELDWIRNRDKEWEAENARLREELAALKAQEPVAWMVVDRPDTPYGGAGVCFIKPDKGEFAKETPLYTAPPNLAARVAELEAKLARLFKQLAAKDLNGDGNEHATRRSEAGDSMDHCNI